MLYEDMEHPDLKSTLKIAGVIDKEGLVYMISTPFYNFSYNDWDDHFLSFDKARKELEKKAYKYYLEKVEAIPVDITDISENLDKRAKACAWDLCCNEITGEKFIVKKCFTITDGYCLDIILGYESYKNLVDIDIESNMEQIVSQKIVYQKALEYKSLYKDRKELEIYRAIFPVKAVNFNVTFKKHGKTATGKISKERMDWTLRNGNLLYGNDFDEYSFVSGKQGEKVIDTLMDHDKPRHYSENRLFAEDIVEITYGKKVLYENT